ncbi:MAG: methyltransferase domain-containing protein [Patescibacteria group bacterium]|jgi:ubiquinone/menaquinone biosynthesis C-methylase UbiE
MSKIKTPDFQIPADTLSAQATQLADPNFINPSIATDTPVNQIANQGLARDKNIAIKATPVESQKNQTAVFGKSELLNANQILSQILGLKTGQRVADLGAGGGLFTLQAARLVGNQGEVYAVDIMKTILSDIESKSRMANLYNIKTVWSNIEILGATKIPEATLDFVFLVNILFQSKSVDSMLSEAARLMKNGAKMLVIDWSDSNTKVGPHNDRRLDPNSIISQAQAMNLILEQQFIAGQYHFGLIFIKT